MKIVEVTPENALKETFFCIKDVKRHGFKDKLKWFEKRYKEEFITFMKVYNTKNLWSRFKELPETDQKDKDLIKVMDNHIYFYSDISRNSAFKLNEVFQKMSTQ